MVICLTNVIGWKINQLVNLTNILVDMYVLYFAYISSKIHWRKLFGRHINPQLFYQLYVDDANQQKSVGGSCLVAIPTLSCFTSCTLTMRTNKNPLEEIVWSPYQPSAVLPALRWRKLSGRHPKSSTVLPGGHW